jgi:ELWxxDGT repeat protein
VAQGGRLWFLVSGVEVWTTDGTEAGTVRLPMFDGLSWVIGAIGGTVLVAEDGDCIRSRQVWSSDGTVAGTQVLLTVPTSALPAPALCPRRGPTAMLGGKLWFGSYRGAWLWSSDGTAAGTVPFGSGAESGGSGVTLAGGALWFIGSPSGMSQTLYRTNGISVAAVGTVSVNANAFHEVGGRLVFQDVTTAAGGEWWVADGAASPQLLGDVFPGSGGSWATASGLASLAGVEYFVARDETDLSLWRTDGTPGGTSDVLFRPDLYAGHVGTVGDRLLLATATSSAPALYVSDGTDAGTAELSVLGGGAGCAAGPLAPAGNVAFFEADDGSGPGLWATDGLGAALTFAPAAAVTTAPPPRFVVLPLGVGRALFTYSDPIVGRELWVTDGTAPGTALVDGDAIPGTFGRDPFYPASDPIGVATAGVGLFAARDQAHGTEPWRSDGTDAGTYLLLDAVAGAGGSFPRDFTLAAGKVWFTAGVDSSGARGIFTSDGTAPGTTRVGAVEPSTVATGATGESASTWFAELGGEVYFAGTTASGEGLYRSDGASAVLVKALAIAPARAAVAGGVLFFAGDDGSGPALWRSDGTAQGTTRLGPAQDVTRIAALGARVVFFAVHPSLGREPWVSDGTAAGTAILKDILPGPGGSLAPQAAESALLVLEDAGVALFAASDGTSGAEVWATDGTSAGTFLVQDLRPGSLSSSPQGFVRVGDRVVFVANDGVHGREPWSLSVTGMSAGKSTGTQTATAAAEPAACGTGGAGALALLVLPALALRRRRRLGAR